MAKMIPEDQTDPLRWVQFSKGQVAFATPNKKTNKRVDSLFTKEPDTIAWIAGFKEDEVFVDIGANVGMYSLWAAKTRGVRVFAFEPESQNYALLNRNIVYNQLGHMVTAYCVALSDEPDLDVLYVRGFNTGRSGHSYGDPLDFKLDRQRYLLKQGAVAMTLDGMLEAGAIPTPDHIKIDVDGFEHKVIAGARSTIHHSRPRSILVEINQNLPEHLEIVDFIQDHGYRFSEDQVSQSERTVGVYKGLANYIFKRNI